MILASWPWSTNFGAGAGTLFGAHTLEHFLVRCELAWPQSSQPLGDAAANAQQDAAGTLRTVEDHGRIVARPRRRGQRQQQLQGDQRTFGFSVRQLDGPTVQLHFAEHSLVVAKQALVPPAPAIQLGDLSVIELAR